MELQEQTAFLSIRFALVQLSALHSAEVCLEQQDLLERFCQLIGQRIYIWHNYLYGSYLHISPNGRA